MKNCIKIFITIINIIQLIALFTKLIIKQLIKNERGVISHPPRIAHLERVTIISWLVVSGS